MSPAILGSQVFSPIDFFPGSSSRMAVDRDFTVRSCSSVRTDSIISADIPFSGSDVSSEVTVFS